jgi:glutaredoxin
MTVEHVSGKHVGHIMLYALSTCVWCKKTKRLLNDLGIEYYYVDVDLLSGEERAEAMRIVERWNPSGSFPILVVNNKSSILGFNERQIREVVRL